MNHSQLVPDDRLAKYVDDSGWHDVKIMKQHLYECGGQRDMNSGLLRILLEIQ